MMYVLYSDMFNLWLEWVHGAPCTTDHVSIPIGARFSLVIRVLNVDLSSNFFSVCERRP
jgi:hypothetical protein